MAAFGGALKGSLHAASGYLKSGHRSGCWAGLLGDNEGQQPQQQASALKCVTKPGIPDNAASCHGKGSVLPLFLDPEMNINIRPLVKGLKDILTIPPPIGLRFVFLLPFFYHYLARSDKARNTPCMKRPITQNGHPAFVFPIWLNLGKHV